MPAHDMPAHDTMPAYDDATMPAYDGMPAYAIPVKNIEFDSYRQF